MLPRRTGIWWWRMGLFNSPRLRGKTGNRPAVDPLFRSAALFYGPKAIGVILSGSLDDGTAGLWEIKNRGGIAVVQDPVEALHPGMPRSAVLNVDVDHVVPLSQMGELLASLCHAEVRDGK